MPISGDAVVTLTDHLGALYHAAVGDISTNTGLGSVSAPDSSVSVSGTVSSDAETVIGTGTSFTTQLKVGEHVSASGQHARVLMICSDTRLVLDRAPNPAWNSVVLSRAPAWGAEFWRRTLEVDLIGEENVPGVGDYKTVITVAPTVRALSPSISYEGLSQMARSVIGALGQVAAQSGFPNVTSLDDMLAYFNVGAGGPAKALVRPQFALMHQDAFGRWPERRAVFPPPLRGMGQRGVGGTFQAGPQVDTTRFAGFLRLSLVVTGYAGSPGTVSVAVSGLTANGVTATDQWSISVNANGSYTLTAANGSSVYFAEAVTGITIPSSITAGTFTVHGLLPEARPLLPF